MITIFPRNSGLLNYREFVAAVREKAEGTYIEYKQDFPSKLGKHIAAFANSYGGYCVLGIMADRATNLPKSFPGVEIPEGIKERIRNLIISQVHPIPLFSIEVTPTGRKNRGLITIAVEMSPNPPHLVGDGRIYVRNAEGSDPVPINDRHSVDRLYERGQHYQRGLEARLARTYWRSLFPVASRHSLQGDQTPRKTMTVSLIIHPAYGVREFDSDLLASPPRRQLLQRLAVHGYSLPYFTQTGAILPRGIGSSWSETEISIDGTVEYRKQLYEEDPKWPFQETQVTEPLDDLLTRCAVVYCDYQYFGPILVLIGLGHVRNRQVSVVGVGTSRGCPDMNVEILRETTAHAMTQNGDRQGLVESIRQEMLRAFGWPVGY